MTKEEILKETEMLRFDIAHESDLRMVQAMVQRYDYLKDYYNQKFWNEEPIPELEL